MLVLNRLKRAIEEVKRCGMQTGSPRVSLHYADALYLVKEIEHLRNRVETLIEDHISELQTQEREMFEMMISNQQSDNTEINTPESKHNDDSSDFDIDIIETDNSDSDDKTDRAIWENNGVWSEASMYGSGYFVRDNKLYLSCIDIPRAIFICSKKHFHRRLRHILDKHFMGEE